MYTSHTVSFTPHRISNKIRKENSSLNHSSSYTRMSSILLHTQFSTNPNLRRSTKQPQVYLPA